MKRAFRISLIVLLVLGAGLLVARLLLSSQFVARKVAAQLAAIYGGHVEVDQAHIGLVKDSTIGGVKLYEAGSEPEPWLTARSVDADLSALGLLTGDTMPDRITIAGASVSLRFGKTGQLLTQLPHGRGSSGSYPHIRVQNSRIILHQEDRPSLVIEGIDADLVDEGPQLLIRGTIADRTWGRWQISARVPKASRGLTVTLQTTGKVHVTLAMLKALPFIPPSVWQTVEVEGDTPAQVTFRYDPATHEVSYHVALNPTNARVQIPSLSFNADHAHGQTVIEDGVVRLRDVEGQAYNGTIYTSANLDFRGPRTRLNFFKLRVRRLQVDQLQKHWTFPVNGRLTGEAQMDFILAGRKVQTRGQGKGVITENRLGAPVQIELHGGPGGFRLHDPGDRTKTSRQTILDHPTFPVSLPPVESTPSPKSRAARVPSLPARLANLAQAGLVSMTQGIINVGGRLASALPSLPTGKTRPQPQPTPVNYLEAGLKMDVDLAQFIEGIGLSVPFPIAGRVSFEVKIGIPADTAGNLKAYRATGTATADHLELADLRLEQVRARVTYRGGVLTVDELHARVSGTPQATASRLPAFVRGTARMGLVPMRDLTAEVALGNIPLAALAKVVPASGDKFRGEVSGTITAHVPVPMIGSLRAWDVSGNVAARQVQALSWTATDVASEVRVREGTLSFHNGRLRIQGIPAERVQGNIMYRGSKVAYGLQGQTLGGRFNLQGELSPAAFGPDGPAREGQGPSFPVTTRLVQAAPGPPEGRLQLQGIQLGRLWEALGLQTGLDALRGQADLEISFRHKGPERLPVGTGRLTLSGLRWHDVELAGKLTSDVLLNRNELRFSNLAGTLGEGQLTGQLGLNLRQLDRSWFNLRLTGIEAARALAPWPALAGLVQGRCDAHLRSTIGREWLGSGRIRLDRGRLAGLEVADWHFPLDWTLAPGHGRGEVHVRESSLQLAQGRATARASFIFGAENRLEGQINLFAVNLRSLLREFGESAQLGSGKLSGRFDFSSADFHGLADLNGILEATLSQTQAGDLPVLRQLTPFLKSGLSAASTFGSGSLRANLSKGVLHIQRWVMVANLFQLIIEGNVITDGRLDLQVTGIPGSLGTDPNSPGIIQRIPVAGPVSVGLLAQATRFLGARLIHLRVTGTIRNPIVRYQPQFILTSIW